MSKQESLNDFWQFCDIAQCTPSSPDISLALKHKNFHKHPHRHRLRAQWVVKRAKEVANIKLHLESVIAASQREEQELRDAHRRTITTINLIK